MRREESEVVDAMARLVFGDRRATVIPPEELAHYFGMACHQMRFLPDEASAKRILDAVARRLSDACSAADGLNGALKGLRSALRAKGF